MNEQVCKILLIDDSAEDRVTFRYYLGKNKECRYEFLEAETGDKGVEICRAEKPDCVLLNYNLPDSDGLTVMREINPDPFSPEVAVVLLTSSGSEVIAVNALKNGAQDYLVKGKITPEDLHLSIQKAVETVRLRNEKLQALDDLRQSEARLKIGVSVADFAVIEVNYLDNTTHLSEEGARLFGLGDEEITVPREAVHATFHPDNAKELAPLIAASLNPDGDGWFAREHRIILKNGKVRWLNVRKQIFFDRTANPARPVRGILAAQDITERKAAEELLRESETRYHSLFELAAVGIARADGATGQFEEFNDEFCRITGYSREELLSLDFPNLTHPDDREADRENRRKLAHGEQTQATYTKRYIRKDGQTIWVRITASMVRDETGKIGYGVSVVEDITKRKQAEEQLRDSEERLRVATDAAEMYAWEVNVNTRNINYSDNHVRVLDFALPADFAGMQKIIHPDDRAESQATFENALADGKDFESEIRLVNPSTGAIVWICTNGVILKDGTGSPSRIFGVVQNITRRKEAELTIRVNEERLNLAMTGANIGAFDWNIKTGEISWTKETEEAAAMTAEAFENSFEGFIKLIHPLDREMLQQRINAALKDGDYECEFRMMKGDGTIRWVIGKGRVFFDDDGTPARLVGVDIDITTRKLAEIELRENQRFTQNIIETAPSVIYTFNLKTGSPTYLTDQAATVLGYSFDEVKDKQADFLQRYMHPEDAKSAQKHFRQLSQTDNGKIFEFEYRMQHKSGEWRWFRSRDRVFKRDENGKPSEILGIALDVTERKKATEEVRESEAQLRRVLDNLFAFVGILLPDGTLTDANRAPLEAAGIAFSDVVGKKFWDCYWWNFSPETQARLRDAVERAAQGEISRYDVQVQMAGGVMMWIDFQLAPLRDGSGRITHLIPSGMIIDERKRAEEEIKALSDYNRNVLESITEPFFTIDHEFRFTYMSSQGEKILWREPGDLLGKSIWDEFSGVLDTPFEKMYRDAVAENITSTVTGFYPDHDRWYEVTAYPSPNGATVYFKDISERKRAEHEREESLKREQLLRRDAEDVNRAKDEFLATLSHELRSPLNAMLGWATMLNNGNLNENMRKQAVSVIERNIRLQNSLIEDLLDASRIISGKMRLEPENISFVSVVQNALDTARPAAQAKGIELVAALDAAADEMHGDIYRLQQIIGNILTNAIKFTPAKGTIDVKLERVRDTAKLTVKDNGIGIGAEILPHIFERFQQADGSTKRQYGGLGLGLTIVKHLAEMHGGQVSAESEGAGKGAVFTLELPLSTIIAVKTATAENVLNEHGLPKNLLKNIKLLIVDDDADSRDLLQFVLEEQGAQVTCLGSACKALQELEKTKFDLLISDLGMAEMDGYDLIRHVRKNEKQEIATIPAIALTGYVSAEDRERVLQAGFQTHLSKPLEFNKLFTALNLIKNKDKNINEAAEVN